VKVEVVVGQAAAVFAEGLPPEGIQRGPYTRQLGLLPGGLAGLDSVFHLTHYVILLQPDLTQRLQRLHPAMHGGVSAKTRMHSQSSCVKAIPGDCVGLDGVLHLTHCVMLLKPSLTPPSLPATCNAWWSVGKEEDAQPKQLCRICCLENL